MARKGQKTKVASDKSAIVSRVPAACGDEAKAVEFLEDLRWNGSPYCPHCGSASVYQMKDAKTGERSGRFLWRCRDCKRQFTVRVGTVLEDSRIPLRHWCYAVWAMCASKKGVSALQVKRQTGLTYKSALFMLHRIRWGMAGDSSNPPKMKGDVMADEVWIGGKPRVSPSAEQRRIARMRGKRYPQTKKTPVAAVLQRDGHVRTRVVANVRTENLRTVIDEFVDKSQSRLLTDEHCGYRPIGKEFAHGHEMVNHSEDEYSRGDVTTNDIESFFAILKRGITGVFHNVSKKHLHRYLSEFEFKFNSRKVDDGERMRLCVEGANGRRLRYREPLCA